MRPRFMNRGSARRGGCDPRYRRGFNEAPIHESGKYDEIVAQIAGMVRLQ